MGGSAGAAGRCVLVMRVLHTLCTRSNMESQAVSLGAVGSSSLTSYSPHALLSLDM